jgi:hypothetical protein
MPAIQERHDPGLVIDTIELAEYGRVVDAEDGK